MTSSDRRTDVNCTRTSDGQKTLLRFAGRLDARCAAKVWQETSKTIQTCSTSELIIDLEKTIYIDTAGAIFLIHLEQLAKTLSQTSFSIINPAPKHLDLLALARKTALDGRAEKKANRFSFVEKNGKWLARILWESYEFITYVGQLAWAMIQAIARPRTIRWTETFGVAERAGVNALPIVALISFIVGLVMAFQAAIPMRMFGAELYVANLIGIAMVRELGPLMTAIVLSGRSASAFAAEIGTMRINEEIDALTVMGIDPVQFLIVPRMLASSLMTPLLTVFANLMGILGGGLVIISFGYPVVSYTHQIVSFVHLNDLLGGLIKAFVFGILIAAVGCIRGYQTQSGPAAVGESTTRAVVTSIILIAVFDGVFSIVYYSIGL